jgi:hypothetical protein
MGIDSTRLARIGSNTATPLVRDTGFEPDRLKDTCSRIGKWANGERKAPLCVVFANVGVPGAAALLHRYWKMLGPADLEVGGVSDLRRSDPEPLDVLVRLIRAPENSILVRLTTPEWLGKINVSESPSQEDPIRVFWSHLLSPGARPLKLSDGKEVTECAFVVETTMPLKSLANELRPALGDDGLQRLRNVAVDLFHSNHLAIIHGVRADLSLRLSERLEKGRAFVVTTAELDRVFLRALEAGADPVTLGSWVNAWFDEAIGGLDETPPSTIQLDISKRLTEHDREALPNILAREDAVGSDIPPTRMLDVHRVES